MVVKITRFVYYFIYAVDPHMSRSEAARIFVMPIKICREVTRRGVEEIFKADESTAT